MKQPVEYDGIDWETYEEISEQVSESSRMHVNYYKGTLTIMPLSELHQILANLLDKCVTFTSIYLQVNVVPTGGATRRSKSKLIGVEPDLSYFVSSASIHRIKNYIENEVRLPPDIVVEIDLWNRSDKKFAAYSELGVSEFWRYLDGKLQIFLLQNDGKYAEIERSGQLPILTSQILTDYLNRGEEEELFLILTDFQNWLQSNK